MATYVSRKGPGGRRVWQVLVRRRGYPQQTSTLDTKTEAEAWAATVESEMARGVFISRAEAETTTLAEVLDRYQTDVVSHKHTKGEDAIVRWWSSLPLARRPIASVRGKDIADAIRIKKVGPRTIAAYLSLLSHLFTIARREWGMESLANPAEFVRKPRQPNARDGRIVDDEETRLQTAAEAYGGEIGPIIMKPCTASIGCSIVGERGPKCICSSIRWGHKSANSR